MIGIADLYKAGLQEDCLSFKKSTGTVGALSQSGKARRTFCRNTFTWLYMSPVCESL